MADLFVERLTGQATADAVAAEIQLVMTPDTLVGASERPARIGESVVPAATARELARRQMRHAGCVASSSTRSPVW